MKISRQIKKRQQKIALALASVMLGLMPAALAADLSLQEAVNMALTQNTSLKVTQKGEDTADAALKKARGSNGVSVSASDTLSTSKSSDSDRQARNGAGVSASLPLYTGGQNQANIKKAELAADSARLLTDRSRENLKLSVIKAYYDALEAKKTVAVRQETVDKYQEHYTNVSQLYSAGAKARIDVIRSSVELSNARQNLIKAQNSYEVDLATLRNYLNINRTEPLNLTTDFSYDAFGIALDDCIAYAYTNRKDLRVDQYKVEQQEQAVKAAKAGYLPSVSLSLGLDNTNVFQPSSSSSQSASASVGLKWSIFDSGVTDASVKAAQTEYEVAKLNLLKDKEDVDLAVRQAYYNMREAEKRLNSTQDAVHQAEEDAYIAREKYRAGEGLMLDIIDAQEALSTAQLNYISAQYDYARDKASVENAMGISLSPAEKEAAAKLSTDVAAALASSPIEQVGVAAGADTQAAATPAAVADELAGNEETK